MKPGWKTTEFWFSALSAIGGAIAASGLLPGGQIVQIIGGVTTILNALGYIASRTSVKNNQGEVPPLQPSQPAKIEPVQTSNAGK